MKSKRLLYVTVLAVFVLPAIPVRLAALASATWYVNGVIGSDSNNCMSSQTACKTIAHAISLSSSGDSVTIAAATYKENLTLRSSLKIAGSDANRTVIDGGLVNTVVTISNTGANVTLSNVTIRNGLAANGGGISNGATLTVNNCIISGNYAGTSGGGIYSSGTLTISKSTFSGNGASNTGGGVYIYSGTATINNSTFSGNSVSPLPLHRNRSSGGGISNGGTLTVNNSTISGNTVGGVAYGGGIHNYGALTISNSTLSGNSAGAGGGIYIYSGTATLQNSIVANSPSGGNCFGTMTSNGYNLSSDNSCNINNAGDLNNTDPKLGPLQNNGGPTQTMALPSGSRAIDAGNPSGCTNGRGHLLTTDQRGQARPDKEDSGGCDMGAYESQND
ncbi:MAG TPA: right-handed parallel beta-helix repeat-containing protein [Terriglobales bacterium]|nr:right-handed parallel beta-helix repeat-containing protein [Terriglobales bacterium]